MTAGSWPSEIDWAVGEAAGGAPFEGFVALSEGSYTVSGTDSYGDGWNGAVMTIEDAVSGTEYSLAVEGAEGSVDVMVTGNADACYYLGCMDAEACNYDATATLDDGSCDVPNLECQECIDGASVDIDSDGDGVIDPKPGRARPTAFSLDLGMANTPKTPLFLTGHFPTAPPEPTASFLLCQP